MYNTLCKRKFGTTINKRNGKPLKEPIVSHIREVLFLYAIIEQKISENLIE